MTSIVPPEQIADHELELGKQLIDFLYCVISSELAMDGGILSFVPRVAVDA